MIHFLLIFGLIFQDSLNCRFVSNWPFGNANTRQGLSPKR